MHPTPRVRRLLAAATLAASASVSVAAGVGTAGAARADAVVVDYTAQGSTTDGATTPISPAAPQLGIDSLSGIDQLRGGELPSGPVVVEQLPPLPMSRPESAPTSVESPVWTATPLELGALGLALLVLLAGGYGLYTVVGRRDPEAPLYPEPAPAPAGAE